jgi:hypothetical protein
VEITRVDPVGDRFEYALRVDNVPFDALRSLDDLMEEQELGAAREQARAQSITDTATSAAIAVADYFANRSGLLIHAKTKRITGVELEELRQEDEAAAAAEAETEAAAAAAAAAASPAAAAAAAAAGEAAAGTHLQRTGRAELTVSESGGTSMVVASDGGDGAMVTAGSSLDAEGASKWQEDEEELVLEIVFCHSAIQTLLRVIHNRVVDSDTSTITATTSSGVDLSAYSLEAACRQLRLTTEQVLDAHLDDLAAERSVGALEVR